MSDDLCKLINHTQFQEGYHLHPKVRRSTQYNSFNHSLSSHTGPELVAACGLYLEVKLARGHTNVEKNYMNTCTKLLVSIYIQAMTITKLKNPIHRHGAPYFNDTGDPIHSYQVKQDTHQS